VIKLLYAIAKAIPALQKILDKFFGVAKESKATSRRDAKDAAVDAVVDGLRKRKPEQQRKTDGASGVQKGSVRIPRVRKRSAKNNKRA
tara:strand:+ start:77 stop:340 length:264 start_codon:yes stop_codon:yes gene_type:complete